MDPPIFNLTFSPQEKQQKIEGFYYTEFYLYKNEISWESLDSNLSKIGSFYELFQALCALPGKNSLGEIFFREKYSSPCQDFVTFPGRNLGYM